MLTRHEVYRQIAAYPHPYAFWPWSIWVRREIDALPELLDENESIRAITSGSANDKVWLAVCTDRRLLFINRGIFYGMEQIQMPLDRVQSIDHQAQIFFGTLRVFDGINEFILTTVLKPSILPFIKATDEAMYILRHPVPVHVVKTETSADVASQLQKLVDLKEKGYLTDDEFTTQKKKLLGA